MRSSAVLDCLTRMATAGSRSTYMLALARKVDPPVGQVDPAVTIYREPLSRPILLLHTYLPIGRENDARTHEAWNKET